MRKTKKTEALDQYRLRNGIIIKIPGDGKWEEITVVPTSIPTDYKDKNKDGDDWVIDGEYCLFTRGSDNPLHWVGGAWGPAYDVIEKL